jgi:O-succinylbenzoic acid--CoA ligase
MAELLNYLKTRQDEDWLIGYDSHQFYRLTEELYNQFVQIRPSETHPNPKILLVEEDPLKFLASFLAGIAAKCHIFLCNPQWKQQEWEQVFELVQPDLILGHCNASAPPSPPSPLISKESLIMIPTGGTSGKIRFAIHTWETLKASVRGFSQYFAIKNINSFCVLPLYHVSGLMQFVRSFITRGNLVILPYKDLKNSARSKSNPKGFFISLVPTQLQFLLQSEPGWLSLFSVILLGGAPARKCLLDAARENKIRLAPTYGMTETASQIVTLKPEDFLKGNISVGQVLPQAKVSIMQEQTESLTHPASGLIRIQSESLFWGYYPNYMRERQPFLTDDLGFFEGEGYLYIIGRNSQTIITGGEKVFPAEVEAVILATKLVKDVAVIGLPDPKWGQVITAVYVAQGANIEDIKNAICHKVSNFKIPKYWIKIENMPRSLTGKLNYQKIREVALSNLKSG